MYDRVTGILIEKHPSLAILETGGIGYAIHIPLSTYTAIGEPGDKVTLLLHTYVREDQLKLFGFHEKVGRTLFGKLISVSGIGPALALSVLSGIRPEDLREAVRKNAPEMLQQIKGIGRKTAARLMIELKEVLDDLTSDHESKPSATQDQVYRDAVDALLTLEHKSAHAHKAVQNAMAASTEPMTLEDVIREALRQLHHAAPS